MSFPRNFSEETETFPGKRPRGPECFCSQHFAFRPFAVLYSENCAQLPGNFSGVGAVVKHFRRYMVKAELKQ